MGDHTETLEIDYDPQVLSFADIMGIFWRSHDPFRPSYCNQYAARVFVHDGAQRRVVEEGLRKLEEAKSRKVATEIMPYRRFYMAEDYHQKYYLKGHRSLVAELRAIYPDESDFNDSTAVARANGYAGGNGSIEQFRDDLPKLGLSREGRELLTALFQRRQVQVR